VTRRVKIIINAPQGVAGVSVSYPPASERTRISPSHLEQKSVFVLLHFCFFARRDDFGVARVVGQAGSLRPIVNRPNTTNVQHSSFRACRYVGQAVQPAWLFVFPPEIRNVIYATSAVASLPAAYNGQQAGCQPAAGCHPAPRAASDSTFMSRTRCVLCWVKIALPAALRRGFPEPERWPSG
jgi:hypothetical protein